MFLITLPPYSHHRLACTLVLVIITEVLIIHIYIIITISKVPVLVSHPFFTTPKNLFYEVYPSP